MVILFVAAVVDVVCLFVFRKLKSSEQWTVILFAAVVVVCLFVCLFVFSASLRDVYRLTM